jgi:hypothetical protein
VYSKGPFLATFKRNSRDCFYAPFSSLLSSMLQKSNHTQIL